MSKVLILGNNGMLGSAVEKVLQTDKSIELATTSRTGINSTHIFDVEKHNIKDIISQTNPTFIINCIGIIKPRINEESLDSIEQAVRVNSLFPYEIQTGIGSSKIKVIQIATDCVFSGEKGQYLESDLHDALDVYGKTKSLGEVKSDNFLNIRVSIVGPEINKSTSLLEWFLHQAENSQINGYVNHFWNGISTFHFGKICLGVINGKEFTSGRVHLIPEDFVTKYELLNLFSEAYSRTDIQVNKTSASSTLDRTLNTKNNDMCNLLWKQAGYVVPPNISTIVKEMSFFSKSLLNSSQETMERKV
jgi:dTDP-4-dehydrorhamnose reductase